MPRLVCRLSFAIVFSLTSIGQLGWDWVSVPFSVGTSSANVYQILLLAGSISGQHEGSDSGGSTPHGLDPQLLAGAHLD